MTALNFPDSPSNGDTYQGYTYNSTKSAWAKPDSPDPDARTAVYANIAALPTSGTAGDMAYVTATNRLYIWNGSGWYNIALINTNPSISGASSSYALATDGTATTVTITATDPEGIPITYSIASDTSGNIATVAQGTEANTNVFTVTPSTNSANAGIFSLTFRASDGINIATAVSEFTLQFSVENSNYTTALITSTGSNGATNGTFVDSSSANKTVTNLNASQTNFSPYRHGGYSTYFDGTGDYLEIDDGTWLTLGNGNFCFETWIYNTVSTGSSQYIFGQGNSSGTAAGVSVELYITASRTLSGGIYVGSQKYATSTGTIPTNTWTHVALVRNGTNIQLYINGTKDGENTSAGTDSAVDQSTHFSIGRAGEYNGLYFNGYITDFRFVNGSSVHTGTFTAPTERLTAITNTGLLTCHLPYIADGSTNGHAITVNGNTKTEPFAPYDTQEYTVGDHGGSYAMVSRSGVTGPSIDVASDPDFAFGTDPFTIEFWYYPNQAGQQWDQLITTTGNNGIFFANRSGYLDWTNNNDTAALIRSSWPAIGQWSHIVLTQDSTTRAVFINGVRTGTASTAHSWAQGQFRVAYGAGRGNFSNIRIVKGTAVYDPSQTTLTVPTAPLTDVTNTKLLLKGENGGIIDKAQVVKEIYLAGNVSSSTTQSKYLPSSMYFDGSGDRIQLPQTSLNLSNADFTVEAWVYTTATSQQTIVGSLVYSNGTGSWLLTVNYNSNKVRFFMRHGGGTVQDAQFEAGTFPTNAWTHVAVTRDGSNIRAFINGTQAGTTNTALGTNAIDNALTNYYIGDNQDGNTYWNGYISDLRVTKGLARYTSNFTPPTAALQG